MVMRLVVSARGNRAADGLCIFKLLTIHKK
jgi:hypothetical protein